MKYSLKLTNCVSRPGMIERQPRGYKEMDIGYNFRTKLYMY